MKEKILEKSLELFSMKGYFNTSVRDIQKELNISTGGLYHHFKTKEDIAKALYNEMVSWLENNLTLILTTDLTFEEKGFEITKMLLEMTDEFPLRMHYIFYAKHKEFMPSEKPVCSSKPFELMLNYVSEGMLKGIIKEGDSMVAVSHLFGGVLRMINLKLDGVLDMHLSTYATELWNYAWNGIKK